MCEAAASKVLKRFLKGVVSAAAVARAALSAELRPAGWTWRGACGVTLVLLPSGNKCLPGRLAWQSGPAGPLTVGRPRASAEVRGWWRDVSCSLRPSRVSTVGCLPTASVWGECRGGEVSKRHWKFAVMNGAILLSGWEPATWLALLSKLE